MNIQQITVYDGGLTKIGLIETWISLVWDEEYGGDGVYQIEIFDSDRAAALIREGYFYGIKESRTLATVESITVRGGKIVGYGTMASGMLKDRVTTRRTMDENAEDAMRAAVEEMTPHPLIALGAKKGISDVFTPEIEDMDVLEHCETISKETDVGFCLVHDKDAKKLLFECYKPDENPNARYAAAYGNLGEIEYSASGADHKNVAVIVNTISETKDEETIETREIYTAGDTDAQGAARREMIVKTSIRREEEETDEEYRARIIAKGEAELVERVRSEELTFRVDDDRAQLGDVITATIHEIGARLRVRVMRVKITSQKNKTTREISIGTPVYLKRRQ